MKKIKVDKVGVFAVTVIVFDLAIFALNVTLHGPMTSPHLHTLIFPIFVLINNTEIK